MSHLIPIFVAGVDFWGRNHLCPDGANASPSLHLSISPSLHLTMTPADQGLGAPGQTAGRDANPGSVLSRELGDVAQSVPIRRMASSQPRPPGIALLLQARLGATSSETSGQGQSIATVWEPITPLASTSGNPAQLLHCTADPIKDGLALPSFAKARPNLRPQTLPGKRQQR